MWSVPREKETKRERALAKDSNSANGRTEGHFGFSEKPFYFYRFETIKCCGDQSLANELFNGRDRWIMWFVLGPGWIRSSYTEHVRRLKHILWSNFRLLIFLDSPLV